MLNFKNVRLSLPHGRPCQQMLSSCYVISFRYCAENRRCSLVVCRFTADVRVEMDLPLSVCVLRNDFVDFRPFVT